MVLNEAGYSVYDAGNGKEAKALILRVRLDLMILDLNMPETDGLELSRFARSQLPDLRIIVVSGFLKGTMSNAAKLFGATAILEKPVQIPVLLSTVSKVIEGRLHAGG
jgi:CheY-like chemotaxis protein